MVEGVGVLVLGAGGFAGVVGGVAEVAGGAGGGAVHGGGVGEEAVGAVLQTDTVIKGGSLVCELSVGAGG